MSKKAQSKYTRSTHHELFNTEINQNNLRLIVLLQQTSMEINKLKRHQGEIQIGISMGFTYIISMVTTSIYLFSSKEFVPNTISIYPQPSMTFLVRSLP